MTITPAHIAEIKEYLKALDLIVECLRRTIAGKPEECILFTQSGIRYHMLEDQELRDSVEYKFGTITKKVRDLQVAKSHS